MSESECRHLPRPVWHPARCAKCGATLEQPASARLIAAAKALRGSVYDCLEQVSDSLCGHTAATLEHGVNRLDDAIAEAGRGGLTWTSERPTVPGWYWLRGVSWLNGEPSVTIHRLKDVQADWRVEFAGPIPEPAEPSPAPPLETEQEWDDRKERLAT